MLSAHGRLRWASQSTLIIDDVLALASRDAFTVQIGVAAREGKANVSVSASLSASEANGFGRMAIHGGQGGSAGKARM